jgi:hypothetical protein
MSLSETGPKNGVFAIFSRDRYTSGGWLFSGVHFD